MPDAPKPTAAGTTKVMSYEEIVGRMRTGDILIFHGSGWESVGVELGTGSKYSHTAMVIRPDPAKPPWIWQAGPEGIVTDPKMRKKHGGAQLGLMQDALAFMEDPSFKDQGYWRRLMVRRPEEFEQSAFKAIAVYEGRPFPSLMKMVENWIAGKLHIVSPEKTLFCAELVAITFMKMGLLPLSPPANSYTPASFSDEQTIDLLLGARFAPQVQVLQPEPLPKSTPESAPSPTD